MIEKDEEIHWQSKISPKFQEIIILISLPISIIGIIMANIIFRSSSSFDFIFLSAITLFIAFFIIIFPLFGVISSIIIWLGIIHDQRSFFATNKKIVDKSENQKYSEYYAFEYSKIDKIEIKKVLFLKDEVAKIRIFPKFDATSPIEWRFRISKEKGVKIPQRLQRSYHVLYNVFDYKPLLKILEQNHVKIIKK